MWAYGVDGLEFYFSGFRGVVDGRRALGIFLAKVRVPRYFRGLLGFRAQKFSGFGVHYPFDTLLTVRCGRLRKGSYQYSLICKEEEQQRLVEARFACSSFMKLAGVGLPLLLSRLSGSEAMLVCLACLTKFVAWLPLLPAALASNIRRLETPNPNIP